jgi:phage terminase large subunit
MTPMEAYLAAGHAAGCPEEQMRYFVKAGVVLQPRQLAASAAARLCDRPDGPTAVGYGGARGGGKSHWLLAQMGADDCQRVPGLKCLLLRKVGKANLENFEDLRRRLFGRLRHEFSAHRGVLTFANGSRIIAGHFQAEKDIDAYLGLEYDVIGIEEATTLSSRKHQDITTCCRTSKPNWRPRIYSTTNPGGIGHAWYRTKFIVPYLEEQKRHLTPGAGDEVCAPHLIRPAATFSPERRRTISPTEAERVTKREAVFIPARVTDNAFTNPEYVRVLQNLTGWQKRAWFDGDWDIAAGQFFTTFRREVHVVDQFDPTRAREWFCALDYGFTHYTVCLLGCTDGDGNVFVVDEHAERLWLPERHAKAIHAMLARHGVKLEGRSQKSEGSHGSAGASPYRECRRFVAGADVFSKQSDGTTVAAQYAKHGIKLTCANTDRINGWAEILQRLGDVEAGIRPTLFIHRRCGRLLETLPALQHDPHRPEDVLKTDADEDGVGGDDSADCLRYLIATKGRTVSARKLRGV